MFLRGRAKLNLAAITSKDVVAFRKMRVARGLAPSTTNLDIKILGIPPSPLPVEIADFEQCEGTDPKRGIRIRKEFKNLEE